MNKAIPCAVLALLPITCSEIARADDAAPPAQSTQSAAPGIVIQGTGSLLGHLGEPRTLLASVSVDL